MNKYQEALDKLSSIAEWTQNMNSIREYVSKLQKLVDKETPKKPNIRELSYPSGYKLYQYTCPTDFCVKLLSRGYRCKSCNQNIDWNNNNEKIKEKVDLAPLWKKALDACTRLKKSKYSSLEDTMYIVTAIRDYAKIKEKENE